VHSDFLNALYFIVCEGPSSNWVMSLVRISNDIGLYVRTVAGAAGPKRRVLLLTLISLVLQPSAVWLWPPLVLQPSACYGLLVHEVSWSHTTHHSLSDSSGRMISWSQRPPPDNTQNTQQPCPRRRRRAAVDLRLRPRDYWDRRKRRVRSNKMELHVEKTV
jgi:hypothetical protein